MPRLSKIGAAALAAFGWTSGGAAGVTASYLVVAGGGGGGGARGGGGGAGGYRAGTISINPTLSYTVIVGAGGNGGPAGRTSSAATISNGNDSTFSTITSTGGGGGATPNNSSSAKDGASGGSGGGGTTDTVTGVPQGAGGAGNTPSTSPSQGNNGGASSTSGNPNFGSGGGGGASAVGGAGTGTTGGNGGNGTASSISGSSVTYAGGGGGATFNGGTAGTGGSGGGGAGSNTGSTTGTSGTANLGGGGGAGGETASPATFAAGGNGGSGIVIISYAGAQQFGGGVVTSVGGNTIHTFTTSGTLSPLSSLTASYLIVAGGAGGGSGSNFPGGGGAGGLLSGSSLTIDTNSVYAITVGAGGAVGNNGSNSSFSIVSTAAVGGGAGGLDNASGSSGGSGGGGGRKVTGSPVGGSGTSGQGNAGGSDIIGLNASGGGGGAGAVGGNTNGNHLGGAGGIGVQSSITGTATYYAGGGGGGCWSGGTGTPSVGGLGGGGAGAGGATASVAGTANTGGGGGGGGTGGGSSAGGSGIVIISYPGSTPQMAGGTVTAAGGNIIHTFTSSGYLTPITNLNNSLRFRKSASAFLNRTPTVAGNRQRFTWSAWVKGFFGNSTVNSLFGAGNGNSVGNQNAVMYTFAGNIGFGSGVFGVSTDATFTTNAVYRDPAAWYHIVFAVDTTQATNTNRMILYVNGVQQTFSSVQYPSQNYSFPYNAILPQKIGESGGGSETFDGYMAEINFVDGQSLTPSSFGAFNGQGVWQPVRYGGSYGTNGFYLPFNSGSETFTASFNGSSQYLNLGGQSNFAFGTGDFTVEFWLYPTSFTNLQLVYDSRPNGVNGVYPSIYVEASTGIIYYYSDSTNRITGNALRLNSWSHIALSRSSGSTRLFVNGVQVGSTYADSENLLNGASRPTIGASGNNTGAFPVVGSISNLRVVKGTAVYTSNFVPSTTPLTAITNTQLLTLQNATIVDNSTNAFTITNNGTVTTVPGKPLSTAVFQDQSPQGNNWTPNNISGASGSTLDYMTDVPTNTSATVANYCVLNVLGASQPVTVSNANLTVSCGNGSAYGNIIGSMAIPSSGKYYFEAICTQNAAQATWGLQSNPGSGTNRFEWYSGTIYYGGTSTSGATYATNDVLALAIDVDGGVIYTYKNGTLQNTVSYNISALTLFPYFGTGFINTIVNFNTNFGQQPFRYTPPAGFVALNTFNLPTPTIGATPATTANKYFDINLYTGNGTSQTIINAGFKPDFVWVKPRNTTNWHELEDSVRGIGNNLYSNTTNAEDYLATRITSLNSDGFSVGSASGINSNGNSNVAWQWRASNTTAVTNTAGSITSSVSANTTAGFSIVTYTGDRTSPGSSTVGHGLGVAPSLIITKRRNGTSDWVVQTPFVGQDYFLLLNQTNAIQTSTSTGAGTLPLPTSTTFGVTYYTGMNVNGQTCVAYCFAQVPGYSAFGSYTGNGSTDGPFIYTGFRPRFYMYKRTDSTGSWVILDAQRNTSNIVTNILAPDLAQAETSFNMVDFCSNGIKIRNNFNADNGNGGSFIYAAFAESPFKYSNAR